MKVTKGRRPPIVKGSPYKSKQNYIEKNAFGVRSKKSQKERTGKK